MHKQLTDCGCAALLIYGCLWHRIDAVAAKGLNAAADNFKMRHFTGGHINQDAFNRQLGSAHLTGVAVHIVGNGKLLIFLSVNGDHFGVKAFGV